MTEDSRIRPPERSTGPDWDGDDQYYFDPVSWAEQGYVRGSFGGIPVLITPELAAQIIAFREKQ